MRQYASIKTDSLLSDRTNQWTGGGKLPSLSPRTSSFDRFSQLKEDQFDTINISINRLRFWPADLALSRSSDQWSDVHIMEFYWHQQYFENTFYPKLDEFEPVLDSSVCCSAVHFRNSTANLISNKTTDSLAFTSVMFFYSALFGRKIIKRWALL